MDAYILKTKKEVFPFYKTVLADLETPLSCYYKLKTAFPNSPSFLLESVESAGRLGRFSFIGFDPYCTFKTKGKKVIIEGAINKTFTAENPFEVLRDFMKLFHPDIIMKELRFSGGAVGYIGYDMVRFFEKLPDEKPYNLDISDMYFIIPTKLIIFDNFSHKMTLVSLSYDKKSKNNSSLNLLYEILKKPIKINKKQTLIFKELKYLLKKEEFEEMVKKAKEYICSGDIIQVVLSQRFKAEVRAEGLDLYRALRVINPSPYMFYLDFIDYNLIGSSPEILVRLENNEVEIRPIAGTRKRGETYEEDLKLQEELLNDSKERAEHVMLVDLGRNDIGRIAKTGSVSVPEFMVIEKYSHVMHIVSSVKGILRDGLDAFDVFKATFPAGTVTGAPKIRAMEIIEELEHEKREFYAGGVGYFSFNGNMDFCITIRTMLKKGNNVYIQAGAGIVADSIPENEYMETINKAKALTKSIVELKEILE
jgi:anthranilate synthase component 1